MKFIMRIETTANLHTVILWDELEKEEESHGEVEFDCRLMFDAARSPFVIDNTDGLLDMNFKKAGAKNLAFRHQLSGQKDLVKKLLEASRNYQQFNNETFLERSHKGIKVKRIGSDSDELYGKKNYYIDYLLLGKEIVLPFSFFSLIVKAYIDQSEKQRAMGRGRLQLTASEMTLPVLQTSTFCY